MLMWTEFGETVPSVACQPEKAGGVGANAEETPGNYRPGSRASYEGLTARQPR